MKSVSKARGTMLLKERYDEALSNVAFNFNLRRYNKGAAVDAVREYTGQTPLHAAAEKGHTVGRCSLNR